MRTSLPSASSPRRRSDAPALYIAAVSKKFTWPARLASKAACSSAGLVPPYALLAGMNRWVPVTSPQIMTPKPSRGTRISLRPNATVSAILTLPTAVGVCRLVDRLAAILECRTVAQRNSWGSIPVPFQQASRTGNTGEDRWALPA
jgi:hypothetical protein